MNRDGILLMGGAGFIGSALAKRLRYENISAYIVGRHNVDQLEQLVPQCSTVIHLASGTTPGSSARHPELEAGNVALTLQLLSLLQPQPPTHLIFFSSGGTVYGNPTVIPATEDSPLTPLSYHGAGKVAQEVLCRTLTLSGHAVTVLRPSNTYGPGQTLRHGFGLIRILLAHACEGKTVEIWGDGENVRDYTYIEDVVDATLRMIGLPEGYGKYNLGSGEGFSINQVKDVVEQVCGHTLPTTYRAARGMDVRSVVLDNSRLNARLDWQAQVGLADGIARTWEWLKDS